MQTRPAYLLLSLGLLLGAPAARGQAAAPRSEQPDDSGQEPPAPDEEPGGPTGTDQPWCYSGDGIEALTATLCHYSPKPPSEAPDTLVVFLHGLTKLGTTWQWNGQRGLARFAKAHGFEVIMPRGRLGAGSKKYADMWNWPGSYEGQKTVEAEVLDEWKAAQKTLEERNGKPFARVWVFGFSAGAYYAASLALRARIAVAGYAVFAGGGAPKGVERWAKGTHPKPPIYVGYGGKDRAKKDPQKLGRALKAMGWKSMLVGRPKVGHSMTDAQVREAVAFLRGEKIKPARAAKASDKPRRKPAQVAAPHRRRHKTKKRGQSGYARGSR
jgi:predicted esterase